MTDQITSNNPQLARPLTGIVPPLVTPLSTYDTLDCAGLEKLLEHVLSASVSGVFILGTTGEGPSLSSRLRVELISRACDQARGRAPVLVGITDPCYAESLRLADAAAKAGASAVVLAAPYYFRHSQADLTNYIERLTSEIALPLFLYNMPDLTKLTFEPETVVRAAELPGVVGLKDSSGDMNYLRAVLRAMAGRPDFTILVGPEHLLLESLRLGAHGGVCGGANLAPRWFVDLCRAAASGDWAEAERLERCVIAMGDAIYSVGDVSSSYLRGLKCALSTVGICGGFPAPPFRVFSETERAKVEDACRTLQLIS